MKTKILLILFISFSLAVSGKKKAEVFTQENYTSDKQGTLISLKFERGKQHNHPLFAIWLADENGKFIETLYVSKTIGTGVFPRANRSTGHWMEGVIQRPAALPYWVHQRGIKNEFGNYLPVPSKPEVDGVTGATPQFSFVMNMRSTRPLSGKYRIYMEINQSWDWNEYWTNNKFPQDKEYKTSSQPALVYMTEINPATNTGEYELKPIGHSHYSGSDGSLNTDLKTITTALKIAKKITVSLK